MGLGIATSFDNTARDKQNLKSFTESLLKDGQKKSVVVWNLIWYGMKSMSKETGLRGGFKLVSVSSEILQLSEEWYFHW